MHTCRPPAACVDPEAGADAGGGPSPTHVALTGRDSSGGVRPGAAVADPPHGVSAARGAQRRRRRLGHGLEGDGGVRLSRCPGVRSTRPSRPTTPGGSATAAAMRAAEAGVTASVSAGNDPISASAYRPPARAADATAVGAQEGPDDALARFSPRGRRVAVAAPSVDVRGRPVPTRSWTPGRSVSARSTRSCRRARPSIGGGGRGGPRRAGAGRGPGGRGGGKTSAAARCSAG